MQTVHEQAEIFYAELKSLHKFDELEVQATLSWVPSRTDRERCFLELCARCRENVGSMLLLNHFRHLQALTMLARAMFELSVEMHLIDVVPDAIEKMLLFRRVDKLKAARTAVDYCHLVGHTPRGYNIAARKSYVETNEVSVAASAAKVWPGSDIKAIKHWTKWDFKYRVSKLPVEFQEFYALNYKRMSWYAHGDLGGTLDLTPDTFEATAGIAFRLAVESYAQVLKRVAQEFRLYAAQPDFWKKLELARSLPLCETTEEQMALRESLGL